MNVQERQSTPTTWVGGLSGPQISVNFPPQVAIALPSMHGTAVISLYTPNGIVIAVDGLRKWGKDGAVKSLTARKIYSLQTRHGVLAFALSGNTGTAGFDFATEVNKAARSLSSSKAKDLT